MKKVRAKTTGDKTPRKTVSGKGPIPGKKPRLAISAAKRSTGAPAPRLTLPIVGDGPPLPTPAPIGPISAPVTQAVVPYILGNSAQEICLRGKGFKLQGWGTLNADLNSGGDGHRRGQEGNDYRPLPYEGFMGRKDGNTITFSSGAGIRSLTAQASTESVLLLVFYLEDVPLSTTPVPILANLVQSLFPANFAYLPVPFNMNSAKELKRLDQVTTAIAESLTSGELSTVRRIFTIVVSHTNPAGDIHIAPQNGGAALPDEVLKRLMPPVLLAAFRACRRYSDHHLLAILTCGSLFTVPHALLVVNKWLVNSCGFHALIGFEAAKLQPEITMSFLAAVIKKFYFHNQKNFMDDCLAVSSHLGSHSGVVYLYGNGESHYRYIWAHPVRAPFGVPLPLSCACGLVNTAMPPPVPSRRRIKGSTRQKLRAQDVNVWSGELKMEMGFGDVSHWKSV
ncbi:hypothetical protein B0H19DRAFT_1071213 [Mycena capillaripes]|nr:hypothetical protein B0H19DRAFT_1071213 [Mycena capillaripes]